MSQAEEGMPFWLLWRDCARDAADNMALDEALLDVAAQENAVVLRIYDWLQPAVSIGCFQRQEIMPAGRESIRRITGGGLVEHGEDLTYTLAIPKGHPLEAHDRERSYAWIHEAVADALAGCGTRAYQTQESTPKMVDRGSMVCFKDASRYDLLSDRGKQAGAAQRRTNVGLLHQGSIRLGSIPHDRLVAALPHGFARAFACRFRPFRIKQAFLDSAESLACERYRSEAWRNRR